MSSVPNAAPIPSAPPVPAPGAGADPDIAAIIAAASANLPPAGHRVVVAMSGGVDSSVVAALAHQHGCETIGVTMRLSDGKIPHRKGSCCAGTDINDARLIAEKRGFAHYVLDYKDRFRKEVMETFADSYLKGFTPNPCIACNQTVKFRDLLQVAKDLNADVLCTGHYIRRLAGPAGVELHRAVDESKDQSYFLFGTTADQLARLAFPLGGLEKRSVRALAQHFGLRNADKPDSQDICFVPDGDYRKVVRTLRPEADHPGEIVHYRTGQVLGQHPGLIGFTIGQRRGIDVGGQDEPLYVIKLDARQNRLYVGPKSCLGISRLSLERVNWLADPLPAEGRAVTVKLRSSGQLVPAFLKPAADSLALAFDAPQLGVAPGQAVVCYTGTRVLGGGFITRTKRWEPTEERAA